MLCFSFTFLFLWGFRVLTLSALGISARISRLMTSSAGRAIPRWMSLVVRRARSSLPIRQAPTGSDLGSG